MTLQLNSTICDRKASSCYRVQLLFPPLLGRRQSTQQKSCDVITTPKYLNHKIKRNKLTSKHPTTPPLNLRLLLPTIRMRHLSSAAAPCCRDMDYISQSRRVQWAGSGGSASEIKPVRARNRGYSSDDESHHYAPCLRAESCHQTPPHDFTRNNSDKTTSVPISIHSWSSSYSSG